MRTHKTGPLRRRIPCRAGIIAPRRHGRESSDPSFGRTTTPSAESRLCFPRNTIRSPRNRSLATTAGWLFLQNCLSYKFLMARKRYGSGYYGCTTAIKRAGRIGRPPSCRTAYSTYKNNDGEKRETKANGRNDVSWTADYGEELAYFWTKSRSRRRRLLVI